MKKPVYLQSFEYADEHDEVQEFRESHKISERCKSDLDEAIRRNFDGMHLNGGFENELIEKYGVERVAYIVATTINEHEYDGRYSHANKEWAKTIPMSESENERSSCCLNIHPAIFDGFADRVRAKQKETQAKPTVFYAAKPDSNGTEDKTFIAVYLDAKSGEIKTLFGANHKTETEIDSLVDKVNSDERAHRDYALVKTTYEKLSEMSKKIKEEENSKLAQDKYLHFTARGDKVLSIVKDRDDRNIAIIQREKLGDFVVAAGYDSTDGTWKAGKYDLPTLEAAEQ